MANVTTTLGNVSAYLDAVANGFVGTRAQFGAYLANSANYSAAAKGSAEDSEAYAIGTRDGTAVGGTDPAYHNNAKYYSEQAASAGAAAGTAAANAVVNDIEVLANLRADEIPDTTQTYTFTNGKVSQVTHASGGTNVRVDSFTYGTGTVTESRTLNTGDNLTIVTNLSTLETTVTFTAA